MNILITGGTGFIGSNLIQKLIKDDNNIVLLTRDIKKAGKIEGKNKLYTVEYDNNNYEKLNIYLKDISFNIDLVFHFAANMKYLGNKKRSFLDNATFTEKLLEWSVSNNVKKFIYASSIDVMGPNISKTFPLNEEYVCKPVSTYGMSKLKAENLVIFYGTHTKLQTLSLRFGNIYGQGSKFIVFDIVRAIREGISNPLIRFYHQIKASLLHMCYIDDLIDGIHQSSLLETKSGDIILLTGDQPASMERLINITSRLIDKKVTIPDYKFVDNILCKLRKYYYINIKQKADLTTYCSLGNWFVTNEKARDILNFKPKISLDEGINKTIQWGVKKNILIL